MSTEVRPDEQGYNGWKNYETWAVKLWLDNEHGTYDYWRERTEFFRETAADTDNVRNGIWTAEQAARFELADALKESIEGEQPEVTGMYADLLGAALSDVDWDEIAENMLGEE